MHKIQLSNRMKVLVLTVMAVLGAPAPISAATVLFSFSYSMPGIGSAPLNVSASGILTAIQTDADTYVISGISGTRNGETILSLLSPGGFGDNDNILFGANPHLTANGLTYTVSGAGNDGHGNVNVFALSAGYTELSNDVGNTSTFNLAPFTAAGPSEIPEPASVTLVGAGIPVGLFLLSRRPRAK